MNAGSAAVVGRMMESEGVEATPKNVAKALLAGSVLAAIPLGAAYLVESNVKHQETLSSSFSTMVEAQAGVRASHASGIASGLLIGGIYVPQELIDRVEDIVAADVVASSELLSRVRMEGLEEALSGNWSLDRLEEYVNRIEAEDASLREIISEGTEKLAETGIAHNRARVTFQAMAVKLMTGESPEEFREGQKTSGGITPDQIMILQETQSRLLSRLSETNLIGGLDPALTREIAESVLSRHLSSPIGAESQLDDSSHLLTL